jgi:hypothetical protein
VTERRPERQAKTTCLPWIALDRGLIRLAHVHQQHAAGAQAIGHLLGREIFHLVGARHVVGHDCF